MVEWQLFEYLIDGLLWSRHLWLNWSQLGLDWPIVCYYLLKLLSGFLRGCIVTTLNWLCGSDVLKVVLSS